VVVPTRDRPARLGALLRSLSDQTVPVGRFEVVVVDDGSASSPELPNLPDFPVKLLRHPHARGPAAARNTGWQSADGALVAFTDDDCRATPGWLQALLDEWAKDGARVVQGRTEPDPEELNAGGPFVRTQSIAGPTGLYETCNIAYPRELLDQLGGFDESFRHACGEDVDLGRRAVKAGAKVVFADAAQVYHAVHRPSVLSIVRGTWIWRDAVRVLSTHPELRQHLVARFFWKPSHPRLFFAAVGILAGRLAGRGIEVGLASLVPYTAHHRRAHGRSPHPWLATLTALPAHVLIDFAEIATMVVGSVRHRTFML
jgi:glycosyltransferase involved in cell wall biosynthesis